MASAEISATPNYSALLKLLPLLKNLVDACCEVRLGLEEAAQIRTLGFAAEAGRWKVPPLPPHLTRGNPLLEPLSMGWQDPPITATRPSESVWQQPSLESTQESGEIVALKSSTEIPGRCPNEVEWPALRAARPADEAKVRELVAKMRDRAARSTTPMRKRRWQQLYWRYPAKIFNPAFQVIVSEKSIALEIK